MFLFLTFRPLPLAGHRRGSFLLLKDAHSITLRYSSPDMMIFNYSYFCIKPNVPSRTCTPLPPAMAGGRGVHFIVPHSLSAKRAPLPAVSFLHISGPHLFIFCILFNIAAHSAFLFLLHSLLRLPRYIPFRPYHLLLYCPAHLTPCRYSPTRLGHSLSFPRM